MFKDESSMMVSFIDANLSLGKVRVTFVSKTNNEANLLHSANSEYFLIIPLVHKVSE